MAAVLVFLCALLMAAQFNGGQNYHWLVLALSPLLLLTQVPGQHTAAAIPVRSTAVAFFVLYTIWALVSLYWSPVPYSTALNALVYLFCLGAILIGLRLPDKGIYWMVMGLLAIGLGLSLLTTYQRFALGINRPTGTLLNWNSHAGLLVMLLLPAALMILRANWRQLVGLGSASIFIAFAIALTQSRGATMALALGTAIVILFAWHRPYPKFRVILLLIFLGSGLVLGSVIPKDGQLLGRLADTVTSNDPTSGRFVIWESAWQMYLERPLTGWGNGSYWAVYPQYRSRLESSSGQNAHNEYLEVLVETGPAGFFLFMGFVLSSLIVIWRLFRRSAIMAGGFAAAVIAIFFQSFFTANLSQPSLLMVLGLYIGILLRQQQDYLTGPPDVATPGRHYHLYRLPQLVVAIIVTVWVGLAASSEYLSHSAANMTTVQQRLQRLDLARRIYPFWELPHLSSIDEITSVLTGNNDLSPEQRQGLASYGVKQLDAALQRFPTRASTHLRAALLLRATDASPHDIADHFEQALKYDPFDVFIRTIYADHLNMHGQIAYAAKVLEDGWGRHYYGHLGYAMAFLRRLEEARNNVGDFAGASIARAKHDQLEQDVQKRHIIADNVFFQD